MCTNKRTLSPVCFGEFTKIEQKIFSRKKIKTKRDRFEFLIVQYTLTVKPKSAYNAKGLALSFCSYILKLCFSCVILILPNIFSSESELNKHNTTQNNTY